MPAIDRRTFLVGSASGLILFGLTGCIRPSPTPTPTRSPEPSKVPTPTAFRRSSWSDDPFARGAISFLAVGSSPEDREALAEPVLDRLFFAGEAASSRPGTVAGAILSGRRAAGQVTATAAQGDQVAVIGAGAAGLTAARALADEGFEVLVIEGRDRIGGRILTIGPNDDWPQPIELGAGFVEPNGPVAAQLAELSIGALPISAKAEIRTPDGVIVEESAVGADALAEAVAWAAGQPHDVSVAEALEQSGAGGLGTSGEVSDAAWLEHFLRTHLATATGADADRVSAWYGTADVSTEGGQPADQPQALIVLGSFSTLLDALAEGLDVTLSSPVSHVAEASDGVSLRLGNGQTLTVDRAVITVPLGVLKAGTIEFDPPLPFRHREAIDALGMGALEVTWLRFDEPFWQTEAPVWSVVGGESEMAGWVNLEPFTGEPVLMGIAAGEAAERLAELSDDEVRAVAQRSLEPFVAETTPEPEE